MDAAGLSCGPDRVRVDAVALKEVLQGAPRRVVVAGVLCSAALAFAGVGTGAVPQAGSKDAVAARLHLLWLREDAGTRAVCTWIAFAAMAGLLVCWWKLRAHLSVMSTKTLVMIGVLWSLPLVLAPPLFSADIYAYLGQGNVVTQHLDPYTYGPGSVDPNSPWALNVNKIWRLKPSPYGPLWVWLSGKSLTVTGHHLAPSLFLMRLLAMLGVALLAWSLPRIARAHGSDPRRALWLAVVNPFILMHCIAGAHNDALMIGLLAAGLAVAVSVPVTSRFAVASALITAGALVKAPAFLALLFLPMLVKGRTARIRAAVAVGISAVATAVFVTATTGLGWGWIKVVNDGNKRLSMWSLTTGAGSLLSSGTREVVDVFTTAGDLLGALTALLLLVCSKKFGVVRSLGLALMIIVALGSNVEPWYFLWGMVFVAAVDTERVIVGLAVFTSVLTLALRPDGHSVLHPPLFGLAVAIAVVIAGAVYLTWSDASGTPMRWQRRSVGSRSGMRSR